MKLKATEIVRRYNKDGSYYLSLEDKGEVEISDKISIGRRVVHWVLERLMPRFRGL